MHVNSVNPGRVAFVTGGVRGIGRAICEELVTAGYRVAASYRSASSTPEDLPEGVFGVDCDITDPDHVANAVKAITAEYGPVEVLVANAGITRDKLLPRMAEADFADVIDTNLTSAYRLTKAVTRPMMRAGFGRIIYISSVVGLMGGMGQANYAAAKAGLIGLARSVCREFAPKGITANVIAPGFIVTDMTSQLPKEVRDRYEAQIPAGRFAQPAEVAAAVRYLASDEAGYVNGVTLRVDGGLAMGE